MIRSCTALTSLALLLACSGTAGKNGYTRAAEVCDQTCADQAERASLAYVGGTLCGERWTCHCALPGEDEASACDPIVRVGIISGTRIAAEADPAVAFTGEAIAQMTAWMPHLLAHTGDMVGYQFDYATYLDPLLAAYTLSGVPRLLTLGESDVYRGPSVEAIRAAFPASSSSWLEPGQTYGSIDVRGVHFVVLDDSYVQLEPPVHIGMFTGFNAEGYVPRSERDWLAADLAGTKLPTVILMHSGTGVWNADDPTTRLDNAAEVMAIFEANRGKIAAVLNGDANAPLYATVNGIHYFTVEATIPEREVIAPHDRGAHSQLEIDTEQHRINYTVWENDSVKGYQQVQQLELPF